MNSSGSSMRKRITAQKTPMIGSAGKMARTTAGAPETAFALNVSTAANRVTR